MIGIVALIFLGPRRMPEMARKLGKIMAEFRSTTQEFKSTWEREINFEEEKKAFDVDVLEGEVAVTDEKPNSIGDGPRDTIASPEIKQVDKESFDRMVAEAGTNNIENEEIQTDEVNVLSDKRTWL